MQRFQQDLDRVHTLVKRLCEFSGLPTMAEPAVNVASWTALDHCPDSPLTSVDGEDMQVDRLIDLPSEVATQTPTQLIAERASPDPAAVGYVLSASGAPIACPSPAEVPSPTDLASAPTQPADVPSTTDSPSTTNRPSRDSAPVPDGGLSMADLPRGES